MIQIKSFPGKPLESRSSGKKYKRSAINLLYIRYILHRGMLRRENECPADQGNYLFKFLWKIVTKCSI